MGQKQSKSPSTAPLPPYKKVCSPIPVLNKKYQIVKNSVDSLWPTLGILFRSLPKELIQEILYCSTPFELTKWSQVNWILCIIMRYTILLVKYILCSEDSRWQKFCLDNSFPDISSFGILTWKEHYKFCKTGIYNSNSKPMYN